MSPSSDFQFGVRSSCLFDFLSWFWQSTWCIFGFWQGLAWWFFWKPKSYGISGWILTLMSSYLTTSIDLFWIKSLCKNLSRLVFPKAPFFVRHLNFLTLMIILMILSTILQSLLMMLLFTLSVIELLTCGNSLSWRLNLNLKKETRSTTPGSGLLTTSMLENNQLVSTCFV